MRSWSASLVGALVVVGYLTWIWAGGPAAPLSASHQSSSRTIQGKMTEPPPVRKAADKNTEAQKSRDVNDERPAGCTAWNCSCQKMSDLYGTWHYREFGDITEVQKEWWMSNKCKTTPSEGTPGWNIFKGIKAKQIGRMIAELKARLNRLSSSEPGSDRLKKNAELTAAVLSDESCFSEPDWPSTRVCGGSKALSDLMARFVKFQLGYAGPVEGFDDERHPFPD